MKKILLLALFALAFVEIKAQDKESDTTEESLTQYDKSNDSKEVKNVAKLGILGLSYGRLNMNYERVFNEKMTLNVQVGVQIPRSFSGLETSNGAEEQRIRNVDYNAFGVSPMLRFYPKNTKVAPRGFYFGPYLTHNRNALVFDIEYDDQGQTHDAVMNLDIVGTGVGFSLGTQWLINDRVSIDWNYFGIGLSYRAIDFLYVSNDPNADYQQIKDDIDADIDDSAYWGKITTEVNDEGLVASIKGIVPMFKTSVSIGYAF